MKLISQNNRAVGFTTQYKIYILHTRLKALREMINDRKRKRIVLLNRAELKAELAKRSKPVRVEL